MHLSDDRLGFSVLKDDPGLSTRIEDARHPPETDPGVLAEFGLPRDLDLGGEVEFLGHVQNVKRYRLSAIGYRPMLSSNCDLSPDRTDS